ncbi:hypothetical protein [Pseudonocardia yunnanensis]|uniref:MFS transporter n=1 Tax=Pseudonocardia yunnanensis TaxID=58107 RepID=A0ABW4FB65_9PSEU
MIIARAGKPFGRYWTATFLADFSDGIRMTAFPLLAVSLTSAPLAVVAVIAIQALPWLLVGPGVGVLVDRSICAGSCSSSTLRACRIGGLPTARPRRLDDT